jgi:copper transport protein
MIGGGRIVAVAAALAAAVALALPGAASAHAYLVKAVPVASGILDAPPPNVQLTYDEAVEPRFAIISVTDAQGRQQTTGPVHRSAANPDTLLVPVTPHLPEGWYLIYWRAISVDGHPVQGAFTFAVGPNPGPAPLFPIPHVSATATSAQLLISRWAMFITIMVAFGLLVMRLLIARPLSRRVSGVGLRPLTRAFIASSVLGLIAIPVYLDIATANDSLRSAFDVTALVPLFGVTEFGRAFMDLELCFALFCLAAGIALWLDRPLRERRSIAEIGATFGALVAGAAVFVVPGAAGHAAQTSPRGLTLGVDWLHLLSGSVWLGGLVGLLVLWAGIGAERRVAALTMVVPRFSKVALAAFATVAATGIAEAIIHMPALDALWKTSYGVAILVKAGLLILAAMIASGNLLRSTPRLVAAEQRSELGAPAARLLRALVGGEVAVVTGLVFVAAVLSSLAPPPPAFALENSAIAKVGPGRIARAVSVAGYELQVLVSPNKAAAPDSFALRITKHGQPVANASVTLAFNHLEMAMPQQEYRLAETEPGVYARVAPALVMVGRWGLRFEITPPGGPSFTALIVDQANG